MNTMHRLTFSILALSLSGLILAGCSLKSHQADMTQSPSPSPAVTPSSTGVPNALPTPTSLPESESDPDLRELDMSVKTVNSSDFSGGLSDQELGL